MPETEIRHGRWSWVTGKCKCNVCHDAMLEYGRKWRRDNPGKSAQYNQQWRRRKREANGNG